MSYCDREDVVDGKLVSSCKRGTSRAARKIRESRGELHMFAGYGWIAYFHPECCPKQMDGSDCEKDHPEEDITEQAAPRKEGP